MASISASLSSVVVVAGIVVVVVEVATVVGASVMDGAVAGEPPAVVHAPSPKAATIATRARRLSISLNHTERTRRCKTPISQVFPTQRTEIRNPGFQTVLGSVVSPENAKT